MSTSHDQPPQPPEPPRAAVLMLRLCCTPERREEIEGDLYELYVRRSARAGHPRARLRYVVDVIDLCARQLLSRGMRASVSPWDLLAIRIYPLRVLTWLAVPVVLLMVVPNDSLWGHRFRTGLFVAAQVLEMMFWLSGRGYTDRGHKHD